MSNDICIYQTIEFWWVMEVDAGADGCSLAQLQSTEAETRQGTLQPYYPATINTKNVIAKSLVCLGACVG